MAEKKGGRISAFIIGALAGAIGGLLYAPRAGKETREELRRRIEELVDQGREAYSEQSEWVKKAAADQAEQIRSRIEATRERLKSSIEAFGEAAHEGIKLATDIGEQAVEKAAGVAESAARTVTEEIKGRKAPEEEEAEAPAERTAGKPEAEEGEKNEE